MTTFAQPGSSAGDGLVIPETPDLTRMRRETGARLRTAMAERGVDAMILLGNNAVVYATGTSWPLGDAGLSYVERPVAVVLANDEWQAVGYQLGVVELIRTSEEPQVTGHLGPDLLGPDWDCAEAVRRLSAEPARPIGEALLDQRNLAGIGNLYKAEVLFLRGVNPWQPAGAVTDLAAIAELARRLLDANKNRIGQVTTGSGRRGEETWVYGRRGRPCRRCGTPIRSEGQQDRVTFWCPSCQPRITAG